jgi:hypothetical protein
MHRLLLVLGVAVATALIAVASAQAASRQKHHAKRTPQVAARTHGAEPSMCWTDEGYGRRVPCDVGGGGGGGM